MTEPKWVTRQQVDFLEQNEFQLQAAKGVEHAEMMEQLGQGNITRDQAAAHLREYSEPTA